MANQETATTRKPLMGSLPKDAKVTELTGGDQWAETPFFAPGMIEDSTHLRALPPGEVLVGILREVRVANKNNPTAKPIEKYKYACMETSEGEKFRVKAPGNLAYYLENVIKPGELVSITYVGKQVTEDYPQGVHTFTVARIDGVIN